ncbi:MAG: MBL fold metallo-hydrolase [Thermoleophilaceae bacterium]|nr:MBL fold metallo-hydrolase [Thermoleophilaceae bacterium]
MGAAALLGAVALVPPSGPTDPTISFLDVGQGDAILIQDGAGAAVLFDGGRPEARVVHLLRASGVRRLSLVVATHASADHHGGLAEVIRRVPTDTLLENGDGTTDPSFLELLSTARARGVETVSARAGQRLRIGAIEIDVLSPPPRSPGPAPEDPNPRAVISHVRIGELDLLLSADAESPAILPLELPRVEILKVAHHGSADTGLPTLLERVDPALAAIDVGAENTYGHPHPSTLAALDAADVETYRTDLDGTVRLTLQGDRVEVQTGR